jgi:hypothetical protein
MRNLALKKAKATIPGSEQAVFDALELGTLCNQTRPVVAPQTQIGSAPDHKTFSEHSQTTVFVDAAASVNGLGSEAKPFRTIHRALQETRTQKGTGAATIVLRAGTHYLQKTLVFGPADSHTTLTSYRGEAVVVSGGIKLPDLSWEPSDRHPSTLGVLMATLPAGTPHFDQLFADSVRQVRARYPNGNPSTSGLHTTPTGWVDHATRWLSDRAPKMNVTTVNYAANRSGPYWGGFKMSFGCDRYDPPMSFWGGTNRPTGLMYTHCTLTVHSL